MIGALLRWMGYSVYFVVALVGFLYLAIPEAKVKRYVAHQASAKLKTKVSIDDLEVHGVSGVTLLGVQVELPVKKADGEGDPGMPGAPAAEPTPGADEAGDDGPAVIDPPGLLLADRIRLDVNTFGLLMGKKLQAVLNAEVSGGEINNVTLAAGEDSWTLDIEEISGVNLSPMRLFRSLMKMDLDVNARLSGKAHVEWRGALQNSEASLELVLGDTVVPHITFKHPQQGYPIGEAFEVNLGDIELKATLDKADQLPGLNPRGRQGEVTTLLIEELKARGEDIQLQLDSGQKHTIQFIGATTSEAIIDLKLVVHFTDEFFAWRGDGMRSDGSVAKDVGHSGFETAFQSFLGRARITVAGRHYYGFHCRGPLKSFKCPASPPNRRINPSLGAPSEPTEEADAGVPGTPSRLGGALERPAPPSPARPTATAEPSSPTRSRAARRSQPASRLVEPGRPVDERRNRLRDRSRTRPTLDRTRPARQIPTVGRPMDEPEPLEEETYEEPLPDDEPLPQDEPLPEDEPLPQDEEVYDNEEIPLEEGELIEPGEEDLPLEEDLEDFEE